MPLLSTFGAASARGFGNLSGIALPSDSLFNTVSFLSHFDGTNNGVNNAFDDSSTSNHTITANGNVTQGSFGPFARPDGEWSVAFDGAGDYLSCGSSNDFDMSDGDITWEAWVYATAESSQGGNQKIICEYYSNSTNFMQIAFMGSTDIRMFLRVNNVDLNLTASNSVNLNQWHHIAVTRTSGGDWSLYIDGDRKTTGSEAAAFNTSAVPFIVGLGQLSPGGRYFIGYIQNVRIVKGSLVYTGTTYTVPTSPLTAITNTKLLTCQSNRFVDNSTSAHTITASGDPAVSAFGPFLTSSVYDAGVNGASAYFDGAGDYLSVPNDTDLILGTDNFTIECWAFPQSFSTNDVTPIILKGPNNSSADNYPYLLVNTSGGFNFGTGASLIVGDTLNRLNQWSHVAVVRNGSLYNLFVNGVSIGTSTTMKNFTDTSPLQVGYDGIESYEGYLQDVRVVKGAAVYTSNFTPPTTPLTAITNTKLLLNMANGQAIDSAAQNTLKLFGNAKISNAQSKFGGTSLDLDGTGDYVRFPELNGPLDGAGENSPLTIEGWFYWDGTQYSGGFNTVIGINRLSDGNNTMLLYCGDSGGGDHLGLRYNGSSEQILSDPIATNTWHHFAMVLNNGSYKFQVFLNGTSVFTSATTINVAPSDCSFLIGAEADAASAGNLGDYFSGYIDDIRISKVARYTSNFTPPTEPFADKGR